MICDPAPSRYFKYMRGQIVALAIAAMFSASTLLCAGETARAQGDLAPGETWHEAPDKLPRPQKGDRGHNIDFLFQALKVAPDDETARLIEGRIWALWMASGSDTADLLMSRARAASDGKDLDLAIRLIDAIVEIRPDYVEAWNQRATLYFAKKDYARALVDLSQVLAREPRHFGALTGLGTILQELGDDKRALEAYRRALAVYPRLQKIREIVKILTEKVEGRNI
jgi:tetratricopeptide (TPR) repeat protein